MMKLGRWRENDPKFPKFHVMIMLFLNNKNIIISIFSFKLHLLNHVETINLFYNKLKKKNSETLFV